MRFWLIAIVAFFGRESYAQSATPFDALRIGNVTVSGSLRTRILGWDWFEAASGDNAYAYSGNILRVGLSRKQGAWDWNAEFAVPMLFGLPSNAIGTGPQQGALGFGGNYFAANHRSQNAAMIFPKQLYVQLNHLGGRSGDTLRIGRFEFLDGGELTTRNNTRAELHRDRINARLIGNFGFTEVGRSMDGISYSHTANGGTFALVAAVPTRGVFQVDGWGWNRVALAYGAYSREWGHGLHSADTRLFAIEYEDWRHIVKTDNRPASVRQSDLGNVRIDTFGGHTLHSMETSSATFDFLLWAAVQTGRWGLQSHRAAAVDAEAGIQPMLLRRLRPWLRGGYYWGSGDGNPNDSRHSTFFRFFQRRGRLPGIRSST